jgi:hypothetical protein
MPSVEDRADDVDASRARVRDVVDQPAAGDHDRDHDRLAEEGDPPREVRRDESAEQRSDGGGDRGCRADECVGATLHGAVEVPVDQGLHRREKERRPEPSDDRPEDDDRQQALRERHRERARPVAQEAEHVGALAADQVAELAPNQDEGRRDERLERDRRLDAAGRRVQVSHDSRDGHVHQRRVDDEHEHRHGEEDGEPGVALGLGDRDSHLGAHWWSVDGVDTRRITPDG